jgi:hypothetical protein
MITVKDRGAWRRIGGGEYQTPWRECQESAKKRERPKIIVVCTG